MAIMDLFTSLQTIINERSAKKVRQSIHDGIFRANQVVDANKNLVDQMSIRQDAVEQYNNQMIAEMTDKDVISAPEIIDSRTDALGITHTTLNERLTSDYNRMLHSTTSVYVEDFPMLEGEVEDGPRIQRALKYASDNNIGNVIFSRRIYNIGTRIYVPSNITMDGLNCATIRVDDSSIGYRGYINIFDKRNITIKGFRFDSNTDREGYALDVNAEVWIYMIQASNISIHDNYFKASGKWVILGEVGGSVGLNEDIRVYNNIIEYTVGRVQNPLPVQTHDVDTTMIYIAAIRYWIQDNIIISSDIKAVTGIEGHNQLGTISGNVLVGMIRGIYIVPAELLPDDTPTQTSVFNNKIQQVNHGIILWTEDNDVLDGVLIHHNIIELDSLLFETDVAMSTGIGIQLFNSHEEMFLENVIIDSNIITFKSQPKSTYANSERFSGIYFSGVAHITNLTISNNTINDAGGSGITLRPLAIDTLSARYTDIVVHSNRIVDAGKALKNTSSTSKRTAICATERDGGSLKNIRIRDNDIIDNRETSTYYTSALDIDVLKVMEYNNFITAKGYPANTSNYGKGAGITLFYSTQPTLPPTYTSFMYYTTIGGRVQCTGEITFTTKGTFQQPVGIYFALPISSVYGRRIPVNISNTENTGIQWYFNIVAGSAACYIEGIDSSGSKHLVTELTPSTVISFDFTYLTSQYNS